MKKRRRKRRRPKPASATQKEENTGRKKYSCYICFDKFATNEELDVHKQTHKDDDEHESSGESTESAASECIIDIASDSLNDEDSSQDQMSPKELPLNDMKAAKSELLEIISEKINDAEEDSERPESSDADEMQNLTAFGTHYKCLSCNVYFQNQIDIKNHIHTQYSCKYYCSRCSRQFTTKGGFIVHVLQHGMKQTLKFSYKCSKCHFTFDDCYQLKRHYVTVHNLFTESTPKFVDADAEGHDISDESADDQTIHKLISKSTSSSECTSVSTMDPSNPITGVIPIFDCDVCYDVFASEKSLNRHKSLHTTLGTNTLSSDAPICIEDDDFQVVHLEKTAQEGLSSSGYQTCFEESMPKLVPALSNDNNLNTNKTMPDLSVESNDLSIVSNPVEKLELTDKIKKMLSGKTMPPLVPVRTKKLPSKPGLAADAPVSKPLEISVPTETANINIVNSGFLQQQPPTLMSGGQSYIMINSNNLPIGSMNRHLSSPVIPQSVLSDGVATIPSTSTSSAPFLLNTNMSTPSQPPMLAPLGGLPSLDQGQTYFVLVPANQLNQNEGPAKRPKKIAKKLKPAPPLNASQNVEAIKRTGLLRRCLKGEVPIKSRKPGQSSSKSVVTPYVSNFARDPLEESPKGSGSRKSREINSDFVMPIITSIATVADESVNKNEKVRKDPASQYESEFAKFLREKNDIKPYRVQSVNRYALNTVDKSLEKHNLGGIITIENDTHADQDSSKPITDLTTCNVDEKTSVPNSSSSNSQQSSSSHVSTAPQSDQKPKIFVKKLTDLIDVSRTSPELPIRGRPQAYTVTEYCGACNESFSHWRSYKSHMQSVHGKLACKFYRCLVMNTVQSLEAHMKMMHICTKCGGEFRSLPRHHKHCAKTAVTPEIVIVNSDL